MDALSSQANVGGYKAVIIAAEAYGRYFPLLTTAAGTAKPANVLILGIGVAGLQAIATARRLGAQVKAYDVRSETREQAQSLGAQFLELKSVADAAGTGGYARELTAEERAAQQQELNGYIGGMDVVITTAQVPGRRPPVLVTADAVGLMKPGSVIVDMAASALGGNVELSQPDQTIVTDNGVTIIAPTNLPATMPAGASSFYARNISALLLHFVKDGQLNLDISDEITAATVISHGGAVVQAATAKLLGIEPDAASPDGERPPLQRHRLLPHRPRWSRRRSSPPAPVVVRESEAEVMEKVVEEVDETPLANDAEIPVEAEAETPLIDQDQQPHHRRCRVSPELLDAFAIFVLAILVGIEVISKVPATLHTPLMSGANSIHGIVLVGAMIIAAAADNWLALPAGLRGHGLRRRQRRRWLRGHRPDARDVQEEAGRAQGRRRRRQGSLSDARQRALHHRLLRLADRRRRLRPRPPPDEQPGHRPKPATGSRRPA